MTYVFGALVGICWGALGAFINSRIIKSALEKNTVNAVTAANMARMLVDAFFLFVAFLLRNVLPLNFVATMVGVAAGLSIGNIVFSFVLTKPTASSAAPAAPADEDKTAEAAAKYAELANAAEAAVEAEASAEPVPAEASAEPVPAEAQPADETDKDKEIRELKARLAQLEAERDKK